VKKEVIPALLIELSKIYFRQLNPEKESREEKDKEPQKSSTALAYQCTHCLSVYDKRYGDALNSIPPGVPFEQLPESYRCHVCDSPKKYFIPLEA
jgi:rubredoxin